MGSLNTFYLMGRVARPATPAGATRGGLPVVTFAVAPGTTGPRRAPDALDLEAAGPQAEQAARLRVGQSVFVRGALRPGNGGRGLVAIVTALELVLDPRRPRPAREGGPAEGAAPGAEGAAPAGEGALAPAGEAEAGEGEGEGEGEGALAPAGEAEAGEGEGEAGEGEVGEGEAGEPGDDAAAEGGRRGPPGDGPRRRRGRRRGRGRPHDGPPGAPAAPPRPSLAAALPPPAPIAPAPAPVQPPPDPTYRSDMPF